MRNKSKESLRRASERLLDWFHGAKKKGKTLLDKKRKAGNPGKPGLPAKLKDFDFDFKKIELKNVSEYAPWIRTGLLILALWMLANLVAGGVALFIRPEYTTLPKKVSAAPRAQQPLEDYSAILRRNMFNVEGKIPDPFDQGLLDCFSQAKLSTQRMSLLGTIVMNDDARSTALIQDDGSGQKIGVRKEDTFGEGKFIAMKVDRKRLCFQVRATQDFEYIEIPEESGIGGNAPAVTSSVSPTEGIQPLSDTEFAVKKNYLDSNLLNLTEVLQTAKAVPNIEPGTGRMNGFLIQSIEPSSPFAQLGLKSNDVLKSVSGIPMDNPGRGLEAFQNLRNSSNVELVVQRNGQEVKIKYDVKN